ncbi:MAG TPA: hypothetical protein VF506_16460 [Streptosporangiaceae bacterium]
MMRRSIPPEAAAAYSLGIVHGAAVERERIVKQARDQAAKQQYFLAEGALNDFADLLEGDRA